MRREGRKMRGRSGVLQYWPACGRGVGCYSREQGATGTRPCVRRLSMVVWARGTARSVLVSRVSCVLSECTLITSVAHSPHLPSREGHPRFQAQVQGRRSLHTSGRHATSAAARHVRCSGDIRTLCDAGGRLRASRAQSLCRIPLGHWLLEELFYRGARSDVRKIWPGASEPARSHRPRVRR